MCLFFFCASNFPFFPLYLFLQDTSKMGKTFNFMKFKLLSLLLALFGFGASCSGTRSATKSGTATPPESGVDTLRDTIYEQPPLRLMYGVPPRGYREQPAAEESSEDHEQPADAASSSTDDGKGASNR